MRKFDRRRSRAAAIVAALAAVGIAALSGRGRFSDRAGRLSTRPTGRSLTGDGSLNLLGFLPGGAPGSVTITGTSGTRSQPVGAGSFSVKVKLDPGENSLTLQDRTVTVFLAAAASATIPPGYAPPDTHAVDNDCEECHAFSGGSGRTPRETPGALRALSR